ncbi:MAG TPA: hypothetical protein VFB36_05890 [Nevskiaceae bacterium]|nr:hypothetical protein [Nevskiaceae bacterium]
MSARKLLAAAAVLLGACAMAPEQQAPSPPPASQKHSGWVDQWHEPRGETECKETYGVNAGAAFRQCIHGWHERIWVEDMRAPGLPKTP